MTLTAEWRNLPDPRDKLAPNGKRCRVQLRNWAWEHIAQKHALSANEPWVEWLDLNAIDLPGALTTPSSHAVAVFGEKIRCSLEKPLALVFGRRLETGEMGATDWTLVLPGGALLIARCKANGNPHIITCFFPQAVLRERRPHLRWRRLVSKLVFRHAVVLGNEVVLPSENVHFVTAESWGFHTDMHGGHWRGTLTPSVGYETFVPSTALKLKPRRKAEEE